MSAHIVQVISNPLGNGKRVAVSGSYAYLVETWVGFQVMDVSTPETAFVAANVETFREAGSVDVMDD